MIRIQIFFIACFFGSSNLLAKQSFFDFVKEVLNAKKIYPISAIKEVLGDSELPDHYRKIVAAKMLDNWVLDDDARRLQAMNLYFDLKENSSIRWVKHYATMQLAYALNWDGKKRETLSGRKSMALDPTFFDWDDDDDPLRQTLFPDGAYSQQLQNFVTRSVAMDLLLFSKDTKQETLDEICKFVVMIDDLESRNEVIYQLKVQLRDIDEKRITQALTRAKSLPINNRVAKEIELPFEPSAELVDLESQFFGQVNGREAQILDHFEEESLSMNEKSFDRSLAVIVAGSLITLFVGFVAGSKLRKYPI